MFEPRNDQIVELTEAQLSDVQGGLLLPAIQKVREAAGRSTSGGADGSLIGLLDTAG